jgi:hypothetical protein
MAPGLSKARSSADSARAAWRASRQGRDQPRDRRGVGRVIGGRHALIAADSPAAFIDHTPTSKMIRQLLGVISEFEKASLVAKLASPTPRSAPRFRDSGLAQAVDEVLRSGDRSIG